jgi:Snf7
MNCLLETVAGAYLSVRKRVMPEPMLEEVYSAEDGLFQCRTNMEARERELVLGVRKLAGEAIQRKLAGDVSGARSKLMERRRVQKRLDKVRNGLHIVDLQLDAIRTSEMDKELMHSLKTSSEAMKRAGIGLAVGDAENVMSELDEQIGALQDVTSALSTPFGMGAGGGEEDEELDRELESLLQDGDDQAAPSGVRGSLQADHHPPHAGSGVHVQIPPRVNAMQPGTGLSETDVLLAE